MKEYKRLAIISIQILVITDLISSAVMEIKLLLEREYGFRVREIAQITNIH